MAVAQQPLWLRHMKKAGHAKVVADPAVAEVALDKARGAMAVDDQVGETSAIGAAGATTSTAIVLIRPINGEQKRILRRPMAR